MKKFFGIALIIIGSLWTLLCLSAFSAEDGYLLFASLLFVASGVIPIILGVKLFKSKKKEHNYSDTNHTDYTYIKSKTHISSQSQQPLDSNALKLKKIRILAVQKFNSIKLYKNRVSAAQLAQMFYSLNDSMLPFEFQESTEQGVDIVGHWKLADVDYLGVLGLSRHDIQEQFDVLIKLDEANGVMRCKDKFYRNESSVGIGGMDMEVSTFSGKTKSVQKEIVFGRKKDGSIGKVADISLDTTILQNAIKVVADKGGWQVKGVVGKL